MKTIKILLTLLCLFSTQIIVGETTKKTLFTKMHYFSGKEIEEILPINDHVVKVVLVSKEDRIVYYFKKGQIIYQNRNEYLQELYIQLEANIDGYGKPNGKKITIISFDYNKITIEYEDIQTS